MAAITFNVSLGKVAYYASLPGASDSLIAVLLQSANLVSDGTLRDYDDLAAVLAGTSDEADFAGYSRQNLANVNVTIDDTNNRVDITCDDPSWSPTASQALGKIIFCYKPSSTAVDADIIPLFADDFAVTVSTGTVTYQVAADGFYRCS